MHRIGTRGCLVTVVVVVAAVSTAGPDQEPALALVRAAEGQMEVDPGPAETLLSDVLVLYPDEPLAVAWARLRLAEICWADQRWSEGAAHSKRVLDTLADGTVVDPRLAFDASCQHARFLDKIGGWSVIDAVCDDGLAAFAALDSADASDTEAVGWLHYFKSVAARERGDHVRAAEQARRAGEWAIQSLGWSQQLVTVRADGERPFATALRAARDLGNQSQNASRGTTDTNYVPVTADKLLAWSSLANGRALMDEGLGDQGTRELEACLSAYADTAMADEPDYAAQARLLLAVASLAGGDEAAARTLVARVVDNPRVSRGIKAECYGRLAAAAQACDATEVALQAWRAVAANFPFKKPWADIARARLKTYDSEGEAPPLPPPALSEQEESCMAQLARVRAGDIRDETLRAMFRACADQPDVVQAVLREVRREKWPRPGQTAAYMAWLDSYRDVLPYVACLLEEAAWLRDEGAGDVALPLYEEALERAVDAEDRIAAQMGRAVCFYRLGMDPEGDAAVAELADEVGDPRQEARALLIIADSIQRDRVGPTLALCDRIAAEAADPVWTREAHLVKGRCLWNAHRGAEAVAALQVLADLGPVPGTDGRLVGEGLLLQARILYPHLGVIWAAERICAMVTSASAVYQDPVVQEDMYRHYLFILEARGADPEEVLRLCEQASRDLDRATPRTREFVAVSRSRALIQLGRIEEAEPDLERVIRETADHELRNKATALLSELR